MKKLTALRNGGVLMLLVFLACANALAQPANVAVWDFDSYEVQTSAAAPTDNISRALSEILLEQLVKYPGTRVVERSRLREILDEQKIGSSALADEDARLRLGRIAGAQQMVFGSLMRIGEIARIDVRLVSVATSQVLAAHEMSGSTQDVVATMQAVARELVRSLPGGSGVAAEGTATPTRVVTLASFDAALALMDRKDFSAALEALQNILRTDPGFSPAERQIAIALEQISRQ
jgi:curli biogenesis system outer membrane secretion channel CsgG